MDPLLEVIEGPEVFIDLKSDEQTAVVDPSRIDPQGATSTATWAVHERGFKRFKQAVTEAEKIKEKLVELRRKNRRKLNERWMMAEGRGLTMWTFDKVKRIESELIEDNEAADKNLEEVHRLKEKFLREIAQRDKNIAEGNMNAHKIKKTQARYDQMVYWLENLPNVLAQVEARKKEEAERLALQQDLEEEQVAAKNSENDITQDSSNSSQSDDSEFSEDLEDWSTSDEDVTSDDEASDGYETQDE